MMTTFLDRFNAKWMPEPNTGCWLWVGARGYDYRSSPQMPRPFIGHNGTTRLAYRVSWELHRGPIPAGLCVCHKCDTGMCVNPEHLFLGTQRDNMADAKAKGRNRAGVGSGHGHAKLNEQSVAALRAEHKAGVKRKDLARKFGINGGSVSSIALRRTWKHVVP